MMRNAALLNVGNNGEVQESALLIAVPEAEGLVSSWRASYDDAARYGVPAHVTILYPFVAPELIDEAIIARVRRETSSHRPFPFSLVAARRFNDKILYLAPSPDETFRMLCSTFYVAFPDNPPYEGRFEDVIPHLTVSDNAPGAVLDEAEHDVSRGLPLQCFASELLLMTGSTDVDSWRVRERFALGE